MWAKTRKMDMQGTHRSKKYTKMIQKLLFKEVIGIIAVMCAVAMGCGVIFAVSSNSNSMANILNSYQREIDSYIADVKGETETFALAMKTGSIVGYQEELAMAQAIADSDECIAAAYYCRNDESLVYFSSSDGAWIPDEGTVFTDRDWYVGALDGKVYLSEPYVDEVSGQFCITISKSVIVEGQTIGVVGLDFLIGGITELVQSSDAQNGYLILASSKGIIMVHPNKTFALSGNNSVSMEEAADGNYKDLIRKPGESYIFTDYEGGFKIAAAQQSEVSGWYLTIVKPLLSVYLGIFVLGVLLIVLGVAVCFLFAIYNKKCCQKWFAPIESVSGIVPQLAAGNLKIHFEDASGIEEIEVLNSSLNKTIKQLQYYIEDISRIVDGIASYNLSMIVEGEYKGDFADIQNGLNSILKRLNSVFSQTSSKADTVLSYAQQIQQSSETVSMGATQQVSAISKLSENMNELNQNLQSVMSGMDIAMQNVEQSSEQLTEGGKKMEELEAAMKVIEDTTNMIDDIMVSIEELQGLLRIICTEKC